MKSHSWDQTVRWVSVWDQQITLTESGSEILLQCIVHGK